MEHLSCRSSTMHVEIYPSKTSFLIYRTLYIPPWRFMFVFPRESRAVVSSRERNARLSERKQTREKEKVRVRNRCPFSQVASRQ